MIGAIRRFAHQLDIGGAAAHRYAVATQRAPLPADPALRDLIRYAVLAANGHNTQPWQFHPRDDGIAIHPDFSRRTPVVDPDDHHLWVSLGCAAETLSIAASAFGRSAEPGFDSAGEGRVVVALGRGDTRIADLFTAIPHRQTSRADFDGRHVGATDLAALQASVAPAANVDLILITDRAAIDRVRDLVIAANTAQMASPDFVAELKRWVRFSAWDAVRSGDGLYAAATGNPVLPAWMAAPLFDLSFRPGAENDRYRRQMLGSAGIAIFLADHATPEGWVAVGRAFQRFALRATVLGLRLSFLNQPVEVARFRPDLARLIDVPGRRADLVVRFGYGPALPFSLRRPVDQVLA